MYGFKKIFSMMLMSGVVALSVSTLRVPNAAAEDIDAMIKRLQGEVSSLDKSKADSEASIQSAEAEYKEALAKLNEKKPADAKVAEAKDEKSNVLSDETVEPKINTEVTGEEEVDLFGNKPASSAASASAKKAESTKTSESEKTVIDEPVLPFDRKPIYTVPSSNKTPQNRGRRPFIRSEITPQGKMVYVASISSVTELSFAKEEAKSFTGTSEENVYLFSDNLANFCQMDTKKAAEGAMTDCQNKLFIEKAKPGQANNNNINTLINESHQDNIVYGYTKAIQIGNASAGYEKNVVIDMQKQFAASNTERDDIQNNATAIMEQTKRIGILTDIYATSVGQYATKNLSTFELNGRELTNIDNQYNSETSKK